MLVNRKPDGVVRGVRFPGRYIQGPGILDRLGEEAAGFGKSSLVLLDPAVFDLLHFRIEKTCRGKSSTTIVKHGGECSQKEIDNVKAKTAERKADVIVGAGGGKALDTAKAAAHDMGLPVIVVPTIASSDAPCSALSVIYKDDGTVDHDYFLARNPDLVLVDTEIVGHAPVRFLAAGIGDALATYYEAESCRASGALNCMNLPGTSLAYEIARYCRDTIFTFGAEACAECEAKTPGPALDRVVEANILLSGIGFESGGVAAAHAIHHGLCELDDVHHHLHGEKVAIGVLAGLLLHDQRDEFEKVRAFCGSVHLPERLSDIGIESPTEAKLETVARRACRSGEILHNEPIPVTETMVVNALKGLIQSDGVT